MKIALYNNWSDDNAELAALTQPNHAQYAALHGYSVFQEKVPWEGGKAIVRGLERSLELLEEFDAVMVHGSDVLFMNQRKTIMDIIGCNQTPGIILARENIDFFPINNDVMILRSSGRVEKTVRGWIRDFPIWSKYQWLLQTHQWNQIVTGNKEGVGLVDARVMNSTHQPGLSRWQLGDFIIHFLDYDLETKIKLAKMYLPYAGDGTWKQ